MSSEAPDKPRRTLTDAEVVVDRSRTARAVHAVRGGPGIPEGKDPDGLGGGGRRSGRKAAGTADHDA